jgi:hypothetical protein
VEVNRIISIICGILAIIVGLGLSTTPFAMGSILEVEPVPAFLIMLSGIVLIICGVFVIIRFGYKPTNPREPSDKVM